MRYFLLLTAFFLATSSARSQDSWQVLINNRLVLSSRVSDPEKNVKIIKSADWKKSGYLQVSYREERPGNWLHSFHFADENEQELLVKDNSKSVKIPLSTLRKKFAGRKQLRIYMIIAPPDPMMAAPVRRIHLATLKLP